MAPRNEAAVREEVIAPLLVALGYRSGTSNDIRYELSLRYPKDFLGRKKPERDRDLRGKADYVCTAGGRVRWTIEAKPEGSGITDDDVEQAYTYARHPEVRAVYFCLCDGRRFDVYATEAAPDIGAVRSIDPSNPNDAAKSLESLLGSTSLLARFAVVAADSRRRIGPGLQSFAQIMGGRIAYDESTSFEALRGLTISITGGAIQRVDDRLHAYWEGQAPYTSIQRSIQSLGLNRVEAFSDSPEMFRQQSSQPPHLQFSLVATACQTLILTRR